MNVTDREENDFLPDLGIITVNWNDYNNTARLLSSLRKIEQPSFIAIVVDNGSTDGSAQRLKAEFPEIYLLEMERNAGFGTANNAAIRLLLEKSIPYSLLLNNDAIPTQDAIIKLVNHMKAFPQAGAIGAIILEDTPTPTIQAYGGACIRPWLGIAKAAQTPQAPIDFLTGACILFRNNALREVGLFDETLFLYWEDADLCLRLQKAGWELQVADAHIIHTGSVSTGRNQRMRSMHIMRSYAHFMQKHARYPRLKTLSATLYQSAGKCLRGNLPAAYGCWQGWNTSRNETA